MFVYKNLKTSHTYELPDDEIEEEEQAVWNDFNDGKTEASLVSSRLSELVSQGS